MAGGKPHYAPPDWVSLIGQSGMPRQTALIQVRLFAVLAGIALVVAIISFGSETLLERLALSLSVGTACVCPWMAMWSRFAVRWMDRNGRWPSG